MRLTELKEQVAQDEQGYTFAVVDPMGDTYTAVDGTDVTFTVVGTQSKARRKAEDAEARRLMRAGRTQMEPEDLRARRLNLATACVTAFHGWEDDAGAAVPFSAHNVREILTADERILVQVENAIDRHSAFLSKGSPNSSRT
jgi:hypothetical protein